MGDRDGLLSSFLDGLPAQFLTSNLLVPLIKPSCRSNADTNDLWTLPHDTLVTAREVHVHPKDTNTGTRHKEQAQQTHTHTHTQQKRAATKDNRLQSQRVLTGGLSPSLLWVT